MAYLRVIEIDAVFFLLAQLLLTSYSKTIP